MTFATCWAVLPVRSAQASVIWTASPTKPILEEWANVAAERGRITTVPFASSPSGDAYRIEIREGDDPGGYGERSELAMGNPEKTGIPVFYEGEDVWVAFEFRMQSPYPISEYHQGWNGIMQFHQRAGEGVPPFGLNVESSRFVAYRSPGNEVHKMEQVGAWPAEVEKWSRFVIHMKLSADPSTGFVEMFGEPNEDGSGIVPLVGKVETQTMMVQNGSVVPTHFRIGTYRGNWSPRPTAVAFYGPVVIATDRASAEANAFGFAPQESFVTGQSSTVSQAGSSSGGQEGQTGAEPVATRPTDAHHHSVDHHSVSLRVRETATTARAVRRRHMAWIVGGIRSRRKALTQRRARVEVYRHHRWRKLAVTRIDSRGRFLLAVALPARIRELRAYVAGIGYSRTVKVVS